jgi:hypothetical protein
MRRAVVAVGIIVLAGCVRSTEGLVRERAASEFACADYALEVEEVGPDVYRASGCGQELIYACRPTVATQALREAPLARRRTQREVDAESDDEFSDTAQRPTMECARRLR